MTRPAPIVDTQTGLSADADSGALEPPLGGASPKLGIAIDVTTATAGSLDVALEYSLDGGANWYPDEAGADSFAQITTTGQSFAVFEVKAPLYRLAYTVVTGPFDFTVRHYAID